MARKKGGGKKPRFRRAGDEEVAVAVLRAMQERGPFKSQRGFREAVLEALRARDPQATVSETRVRRVALRSNTVHLEIAYKDGSESVGDECPVCGAALRKVRNRTLTRKTVVMGYECPECVYRTGPERRRPARYGFSPRRL